MLSRNWGEGRVERSTDVRVAVRAILVCDLDLLDLMVLSD